MRPCASSIGTTSRSRGAGSDRTVSMTMRRASSKSSAGFSCALAATLRIVQSDLASYASPKLENLSYLPKRVMCRTFTRSHSEAMSSTVVTDLGGLSQALVDLIQRTTPGIVAVKAAPYRVVSGVVLKNDLIAVADHALRREERVPVHSSTGGEVGAAILGRDPSVDLAILRAEGLNAPPLPSADPALLKPGMLAAVAAHAVLPSPIREEGEKGCALEQDSFAPLRPIRLFEKPERIEATAEVPDGPPRQFTWRNVRHVVAHAEGPERIAMEWWRDDKGRALTRDYFRVEDKSGLRFWLFRSGLYRDLADGVSVPRWFLHGMYA